VTHCGAGGPLFPAGDVPKISARQRNSLAQYPLDFHPEFIDTKVKVKYCKMKNPAFPVLLAGWLFPAVGAAVEGNDLPTGYSRAFIRLAAPVESADHSRPSCPEAAAAQLELARLIPRLKGSWRLRWPEGRIGVWWWIDSRGIIAETWQGPGGQKIRRQWMLKAASENELEVEGDDGQRERWSWVAIDRRRMIVGRNLPGPRPLKWGGENCLAIGSWRLRLGEELCRVEDENGKEIQADCFWHRARPGRRLVVRISGADREPAEMTFRLINGWLVEERLVRSGWFEKR
jgi:hypothetical protein